MQGCQTDLGRPRNREEVVEKLYATMQDFPGHRFVKLVGRADEGKIPEEDWGLDDHYIFAAEDIRFNHAIASSFGPLASGVETESFWTNHLLGLEQRWHEKRSMASSSGKTQRVDYYTYIQSDSWRQKANQAKQHAGYRCQICNRPAAEVQLDAHHRTYERLGDEAPEDITVLCRDCHSLYEANKKLKNRPVLADAPKTSLPTTTGSVTALPVDPGGTPNVVAGSSEFRQQVEPEKHLLARMGMAMYWTGFLGNALWLLAIETNLVWGNWWQLINPLLHLQAIVAWITSALFWQLGLVTAVGLGLMMGGMWLVNKIRPNIGALRWYWRWSPPAMAKVPFFLLVVANALLLLQPLAEDIVYVVTAQPTVLQFPLVLTVLITYLALLPLPLVHLVWDNSSRSGWGKVFATIGVQVIVLALSFMTAFALIFIANG